MKATLPLLRGTTRRYSTKIIQVGCIEFYLSSDRPLSYGGLYNHAGGGQGFQTDPETKQSSRLKTANCVGLPFEPGVGRTFLSAGILADVR
jgi:hypothetical protein